MAQKTSFILFVSIMILILSTGCYYLGRRIIWLSPFLESKKIYVYVTLILFVGLQILGPMLYRISPIHTGQPFILQWLTYVSMGFLASLFFYFLSAELLSFILQKIFSYFNSTADFQVTERRLFLGTGLLSLFSAAVGTRTALAGPVVESVDISLPTLPKEFDGLKICQISDLHVGPTIDRNYAQKVVDLTLAQNPDLIVLTGDIIDGYPEVLRSQLEPLKNLRAPHGVFYCTGNHEYYWGIDIWLKEFQALGFTILNNEHHLLNKGASQICIGGITDLKGHQFSPAHQSDAKKAFEGVSAETVKILLAHQPASYTQALECGVHLQLSGHTHGGQFFPWSLLVAAAQRFYKGLYFHETMWIYTNRGTGYWGPPQRFTVPSEITVLRLNSRPRQKI